MTGISLISSESYRKLYLFFLIRSPVGKSGFNVFAIRKANICPFRRLNTKIAFLFLEQLRPHCNIIQPVHCNFTNFQRLIPFYLSDRFCFANSQSVSTVNTLAGIIFHDIRDTPSTYILSNDPNRNQSLSRLYQALSIVHLFFFASYPLFCL